MKNKINLFVSIIVMVLLANILFAAPPTVRIVSPVKSAIDGWSVKGEVSFTADAKDEQGVSKVEFYVDDKLVYTDNTYPYSWMWYSAKYSFTNHTLKVIAYDIQSQSTTVQRVIKVNAPLTGKTPDGSVVTNGYLPPVKPVFDAKVRDVSVTKGGDGNFYMVYTGSSNNAWVQNEGINLWKSTNLQNWEYVGLIWSFMRDGTPKDTTWSDHNGPIRAVWAPEIYFTKGNYYLTSSSPPGNGTKLYKSSTGKPEGPYINVKSDGGTLFGNIDGSLFTDTDGTSYLCYLGGNIGKMNEGMTGWMNPLARVGTGLEGGFVFKGKNGLYYLSEAKFMNGRYSSWMSVASKPMGPYSKQHEALPSGGHNTYFYDSNGELWGTFWGNDGQAPFREQVSLVKMKFNPDSTIAVADKQPGWLTGNRDCNRVLNGTAYTDNCNVCVGGTTGRKPCVSIPKGTYYIKSVISGLCLQASTTSVTQQTCSNIKSKQWKFEKKGYNYVITSLDTLYLNYPGTSTGTVLGPAGGLYNPRDNQITWQWRLEDAGNSQFNIIPVNGLGQFATVTPNGSGGSVQLTARGNQSTQKFYITSSYLVTGTDEDLIKEKDSGYVYPNPSQNNFQLKLQELSELSIYNGQGMLTEKLEKAYFFSFGENYIPGIYHVKFEAGNSVKILKIIKK